MKRPSFQFYPADWLHNAKLRRANFAGRGVWMDCMCVFHDGDEYGLVRWPLKELARVIGCKISDLTSLREKGILKGADTGETCAAYAFAPHHAGKAGEPVVLIPEQEGPIWYSSRMVADEYKRTRSGGESRFKKAEEDRSGTSERARLRAAVHKKTGGKCHHCGEPLTGRWEIDHLIPRANGGRHIFNNLVPSCVPCNQDKSDTMPEDWSPPSQRHGDGKGSTPTQRHGSGATSSSTSSSSSTSNSTPRPVAVAVLVRQLEHDRGKAPSMTSSDPRVIAWAEAGITDEQVKEAHALAVADRAAKADASPINAGFLDIFVAKVMNPSGGQSRINNGPATTWWTSQDGIIAKAKACGLTPSEAELNEPGGFLNLKCRIAAEIGPGPWIDQRNATEKRVYDYHVERKRAA